VDSTERLAGADPPGRVASWGLLATVLTAGLSYVLQVAVGRLMAPASYSETQSLLGLFMMLAMTAAPVLLVVTRRVVEERARQDEGAVHALLNGLLARTALVGAALLVALFLARQPVADALRVTTSALPLFAVSVITNLLYFITVAVLLGQLRWRAATLLPVVLGTARLVLSLLFVHAGYGVAGVFAAIAISTSACFVAAYLAAVRFLPPSGRYRPLRMEDIALASSINAAFWFLVHVDTAYVNRELGDLAARGYAAAATLARPVVYFPFAVNNLLFPFLTSAAIGPERRRVLARMFGATIALDVVVLSVLAAAPEPILRLTFGPEYVGVSGILPIVAAVLTSLALVNVFLYDGLARHDRVLAMVFVSAAALAGLLLVATTPTLFGMLGILLGCAAIALVAGAVRGWTNAR
jgi:O-antigen/teichoic acid export membrane protein